jgi:hypothetical protein
LRQIADWLKTTFEDGKLLTGIIYLHPITHTRLQGSSLRTMSMFDKVCGEGNEQNILLATTFWNSVHIDTGVMRERELGEIQGLWKDMKDRGSRTERIARDYSRFLPILAEISRKGSMRLQVVEEMQQGKALEETMAGLTLTEGAGLKELEEDFQKRLARSGADELRRKKIYEKLAELAQAEARFKQKEDGKLAEQLKQAEQRHKESLQKREEMLEREKQEQAKLKAQKKRWQLEQKREARRKREQDAAKQRLRASEIQRSNIDNAVNRIRAAHAAGLLNVKISGIQLQGLGFHKVDSQGMSTSEWSVTRSAINHWCDGCRRIIGAQETQRESHSA